MSYGSNKVHCSKKVSTVMLLYANELVAPPSKPPQGLQLFEPRRQSGLKEKLKVLLDREFAYSSVHGLHHAFILGQRQWLTYFWLLIVICSSAAFFTTYSLLKERHNAQTLVTVVETTQLPVYSIEFPSVAICPLNHVNWIRARTAAARFLPANADDHVRSVFKEFMIGMERSPLGNYKWLAHKDEQYLIGLANLSMTTLATYLAYRCEELFVRSSCMFDQTNYDCCSLFAVERTQKGHCLVFNSLMSEDSRKKMLINPFYPYKLSSAGEGTGLQFTLYLNESYVRKGSNIPFAVNLMIKEPRQWTQTNTHIFHENTENFISIHPVIIETSQSTRHLSPRKRHCAFSNEKEPLFPQETFPYSRDNCVVDCLNRAVISTCNCTNPIFFPNLENTRECGVLDFKCLAENLDVYAYTKLKNEEKFIKDKRRGQYCHCFNNCLTRQYKLSLNVRQLKYKANTTKLIKGDIFYSSRVITKYETRLEYTFLDLAANFGGILALFIGASSISFAELIYIAIKLSWTLLKAVYTARSKVIATTE